MIALVHVDEQNTMFSTFELKPKSNLPTAAENEDRYSIGRVILTITTQDRK